MTIQLIETLPLVSAHIPKHLKQYGGSTIYLLPDNGHLIVLPTANVSLPELIEENWDPGDRSKNHGNFRRVRSISKLINGNHTNLYVKSPERIFNGSYRPGTPGQLWWGGKRSGEKAVFVDDSIVEEQVEWEAVVLIKLVRNKIRAEVPQAIVEDNNGKKELIVKGIDVLRGNHRVLDCGPSLTEIKKKAKSIGLIPNDFSTHNALTDKDGYINVIDVNRWEFHPYTDEFRQQLLKAIQEKVK